MFLAHPRRKCRSGGSSAARTGESELEVVDPAVAVTRVDDFQTRGIGRKGHGDLHASAIRLGCRGRADCAAVGITGGENSLALAAYHEEQLQRVDGIVKHDCHRAAIQHFVREETGPVKIRLPNGFDRAAGETRAVKLEIRRARWSDASVTIKRDRERFATAAAIVVRVSVSVSVGVGVGVAVA